MPLVEKLKEAKITVDEVTKLLEAYKGLPVEALKERVQLAYNIQMLGKLKEALQPGQENLSSKLCDFLEVHWTFVKDKRFYTAFPDADSTKLLCQLAEILAKEIEDPSVTALSLLMPGVSVEDDTLLNNSAPAFDIEKPLAKQLAMHIIDDSGACLIPVSVLMSAVEEFSNVEAAAGPSAVATGTSDPAVTISFEKLRSPYYDCLSYGGPEDGEAGFVTKRELTRLFQHSDLTRTIESQYQSYIALRTQKDNLLGQLTLLANKLQFNSVVGIGGEEIAGSGGELAIRQFFDFYNKLNKDQVDKLPRALKAEIKLLRQCIGEYREEDRGQDGRIVAIQPIMTCLATRKSALRNSMVGQDTLMESISIGGANRAGLLQKSEEDLTESLKDLQGKFNSGAYKGADCFPLTLSILKSLELDFSLENFAELQDILSDLTAVEIASFTEDKAAAEKIATAVGSLENWVLLLHTFSVEKLKALHGNYFLEDLINKILAQSITKVHLFNSLIMQFDGEKVGLIVNLVRDCLIKNAEDFENVLRYLPQDQRTAVYEALGPQFLSGLIKSAEDFNNFLYYLTEAQTIEVCEVLGWYFLIVNLAQYRLIKSAEDFKNVLRYLTKDKKTAVYEALGLEFISGLIKSAKDFKKVIIYLTEDQLTAVCDKLGSQRISGWIQSAEYSIAVLDYLTEALGANVLRYLPQDKRTAVCKALGPQHISGWIQSAEDFKNVFFYLTRDQRAAVYKVLGPEFLSGLIHRAEDFENVTRYLTAAQITAVCKALGPQRISGWIQSAEDFKAVLKYLLQDQSAAVCNEPVEQKRLKEVFERAGVNEEFLKQLASNRNSDKKLLLVVAEITKSVDVLGAILHFHSKDNKVSQDLLLAVVKNEKYCENKNRVQLLKSFYKSQCRSSIFNRADDVFGTDKNINKIECVIDKLYERCANNPQGASAKTLAAICRLRDYKFMKEYYVSKCRSSFFNNSNNIFKDKDCLENIKTSLLARDKNNGASAATLDFFQLIN